MWADIETEVDMLNFAVVANTAAELIKESNDEPLSIGVSGGWGVGKSSLVKMIKTSLLDAEKGIDDKKKKYIFIDFNAWLYQGYEEAKMALLQVVADRLLQEARNRDKVTEKALRFVKRIKWLKAVQYLYPIARNAAMGTAIGGPVGGLIGAGMGVIETSAIPSAEEFKEASDNIEVIGKDLDSLISKKEESTLPKEIDGLRKNFSEILTDLDIRLVVVVDDLDRCLPHTAISTLEAMRLLLFMPRSSFIVAADEEMIRSAVRVHFGELQITDSLVTSYFDKLIQVPLRVPRLGTNEVKAYISLLFGDLSRRKELVSSTEFNQAKEAILNKLKKPWEGSLTYEDLKTAYNNKPELLSRLSLAEEISSFLSSSDEISGNPRLIKRFMNNLIIREKIANAQGISIDFEILVKFQLFERCVIPSEFEYLSKIIVESGDGKPEKIMEIEQQIINSETVNYPAEVSSDFFKKWLAIKPALSNIDLRPYLYLSQDRSLTIAQGQELSEESQSVLNALITAKNYLPALDSSVKKLAPYDAKVILKLLIKYSRTNQYKKETLLPCLNITKNFPDLSAEFVVVLKNMPFQNIKPDLVASFRNQPWGREVFEAWKANPKIDRLVKKAIENLEGR
ncbi:KAP family P-loop NTPase fold protein [Acinetobacter seifertii]|uniref:KAP family P-loop NTPase fold protein n=1 Tax=Acinetobacter seifertii TaxID=1530123 RepID=UPI001F056DA4|nr:P-loop NTPase fold protein [Acinetobacter seifertii]MCH2003250.1 P-loop NTPase fold protein [Acinetobacter seifertii]